MFKIFNIYSDNMIFQRNEPIRLCGICDDESDISAELIYENKCIQKAAAYVSDGRWAAELGPLSACRKITLRVVCGRECIELKNIAVGDVWLCSGQSNIECGFDYCVKTEKYTENFEKYDIRFLDMEQNISFDEESNLRNPKWLVVDNENYLPLSTVSCIFGQCLAKETDVPIGLVKNYRGGNSIITYLSEESLSACDDDGIFMHRLESEKKEIKSAWSMIPTAFYNAMTSPLKPFSFKGMLWYQGETDSAYSRPVYYKKSLKRLIGQYRETFGDKLPVILVQLCPFETDPFDYKKIRQHQLEVSKETENTYLVITADLGPSGEEGESAIHPKYKTPIGERCAMAALSNIYNTGGEEWCGPVFEYAEAEGDNLVLYFGHYGDGLLCSEDALSGFEAGENEFFINGVPAEITDKNKVTLKGCAGAKIIRYAYNNMAYGNLTNNVKIPASPFIEKL